MRKISPVKLLDNQKHLSAPLRHNRTQKNKSHKTKCTWGMENWQAVVEEEEKQGNERTSYKGLAMNLVSYKYEANLVAGGC